MSDEGKTAVVTGGASGIGAATVDELVRRGWRVAIGDIDLPAARKRAEADPNRVLAFELDVRRPHSAADMCDRIVEQWGRLDLVVNNAGVTRHAAVEDISLTDWAYVLDVNLTGTLVVMQAAAPHMLKARCGSIVNTSSVTGARGAHGRAPYAAAKAAIVSLTMTAAVEWASRGVRVNAIAPGYTDTPLMRQLVNDGAFALEPVMNRTPMRRLAAPEEIARVTAFLGGDESSYITGQVIYVDGGFMADYGIPSLHVEQHR